MLNLWFQAATPLMLDVVPLVTGSVAIIGGVEGFHSTLQFLSTGLSFIPVVTPLSAILFIKCYRTAVWEFKGSLLCWVSVRLGWKTDRQSVTSHTAVSPLPSTIHT